VVFDDGTVWSAAELADLRYLGTAGDDFMFGTDWSERLEGLGGNDSLWGAQGDDVYVLQAGGTDMVTDFQGNDEVRWQGVSPAQVERIRPASWSGSNTNDLVLRIAGTTDTLTLSGYFFDPLNQVERVVFDDGTVWSAAELADLRYLGTAGDDFMFGTDWSERLEGLGGDDTLFGGGGSDVLVGGAGADTYVFTAEDDAGNSASIGAGDRLQLPGLSRSSVLMTRDEWNLYITVVDTGASITLQSASGLPGEEGWRVTLEFGDGSVWLPENVVNTSPYVGTNGGDVLNGSEFGDQIFALDGNDVVHGNDGHDVLYGGAGQDTLFGGAGNDTVFGMAGNDLLFGGAGGDQLYGDDGFDSLYGDLGNDLLDGGAGNDDLQGGAGNDTYRFARGGGFDVAWEFQGTAADLDIVSLSADIAPTDISVEYVPSTQQFFNDGGFLLHVNGDGGTLKLIWSPTTGAEIEIEEVRFADGTVWTETTLAGLAIQNGHAPTVVNPIGDQSAVEDAAFTYVVPGNVFADADSVLGDSIAYSATRADGATLPSWLAFDAATRTFSGTPANGDVGTVSVRVTATDESGRTASDVLDITVANTNDAPTLANAIADQSAAEDSPFSFTVPAGAFADVDAGDTLTYSASLSNGDPLPSWLSFDAVTRTFSGTPSNGNVGTVSVRVTATDGASASASDVFDIAVVNTNDAPTLVNAIADQSAQDTVAFSFTVPLGTFADVDAGDTLAYSATLAGGGALPAWLSFNPATRTFTGTPGTANMGSISVEVRATDGGGLFASDLFAVNVGAAPDQTITGNSANNTLVGGSGNDTINGLGGADNMSGGLGNDTYFVDNVGDVVNEAAGAGIDTVNSSINYTLGLNVENLTLTGTANRSGTGNALDNILTGNSGANTLTGGAGNDTYFTDSGDSVTEVAGGGDDIAHSSVNRTLWANVEALILDGASNLTGTGNSAANLIRGNTGGNTLQGSGGVDILEGGGGNDTLSDTSGNGLLNGGAGADSLTGGSARELYIGGAGNDTMTTGSGADLIAFNAGDGQDVVNASSGTDNTLSLGGAIAYEDLRLSRSGNNLVLATGAAESITFAGWYSATANRSILSLQVIAEAMEDFDAGSSDPLLNHKVQRFDFQGLVGEFEASGLSSWALTSALLEFHLGGSDTEALGGDLAYRYGRDGSLAGIGFTPAQQVLGASQFGTATQTLRDDATLEQGAIRLG
jgi:Ca2+-binding RTX toxin-like protein